MNTGEVIRELKNCANIFEVYRKTTFKCYRKGKNGNTQEVEVSILDAGPDERPELRYHCVARSEDGRIATGNPDSSKQYLIHSSTVLPSVTSSYLPIFLATSRTTS